MRYDAADRNCYDAIKHSRRYLLVKQTMQDYDHDP
jgi:hypothetical protein